MTDERMTAGELLGEGEYESRRETIMQGFKVFQRRYVFRSTALQIVLLIIAAVIQAVNIATAGFSAINGIILLVLLAVGIFILQKPRLTYNKLEESIADLDGIIYKAQMYTTDSSDSTEENSDGREEDSLPPATVIHLDQGVVDILCTEELFVVYIKGSNMYVIPRSCFGEEGSVYIAKKYEDILGTHFIIR